MDLSDTRQVHGATGHHDLSRRDPDDTLAQAYLIVGASPVIVKRPLAYLPGRVVAKLS